MFSLYGKCLGFIRNVMDSNDASEENCYFQSGSKHNYRLANLENTKVGTKNLHSKIAPSFYFYFFMGFLNVLKIFEVSRNSKSNRC